MENFNFSITYRSVVQWVLYYFSFQPILTLWLMWLFIILSIFNPSNKISANDYLDWNRYYSIQDEYPWLNAKYYEYIDQYKVDIPMELGIAIIQTESKGRNIRGGQNSNGTYDYGLGQINEVHVDDPSVLYDPETNIRYMCWYLNKCYKKANGNIEETARLYNQGLAGKKWKYNNWKYPKKVFKEYCNLTMIF